MAKAYTLNIAADTRAVKSAVDKGLIEPLDDALDILDDIGRNRDLDKLERGVEDAQDETKKLSREFSDLATQIKSTGRKGKTDLADPLSDDLREVGDEAKSNAAEMFSSFDGSFDSIADAAQGTLGGLVGSLGGVGGAAIAAAGAAGLGLVFAELQKQEESAKRLKEYLGEAYRSAVEEGRKYIDQATILQEIQDIQWNPERVGEYEEAQRDALTTGISLGTVLAARAGDQEALNEVIAVTREKWGEVKGEIDDTAITSKITSQSIVSQLGREAEGLGDVASRYEGIRDEVDKNMQKAEESAAIVAELSAKERAQIQRTRDADQARYEAAAQSRGALASAPPVVVPVRFQEPDAAAVHRNLQRKLTGIGPVRVDAAVYTRNGTPVY